MTMALFGPAGNPDAFYDSGYKRSVEMPVFLRELGLFAYEYQLSRGVNIGEETARAIGLAAFGKDINVSVHAPYYISLATEEEQTAQNTCQHILRSLRAAVWLGADRVIFHIGGAGKGSRPAALERAKRLLTFIIEQAERENLHRGVWLVPESHGKINQLGTVDEILDLCKLADWLAPCIDFGHMHAVTHGGFTTRSEYGKVFDKIGEKLANRGLDNLHIHFSKLEFTKAGEKRHGTFDDYDLGPPYQPMLEEIVARGLKPRIICESAGTQARDALVMQEYYHLLLNTKS